MPTLSAKEFADLTGHSDSTIRRWIDDENMPAERTGRGKGSPIVIDTVTAIAWMIEREVSRHRAAAPLEHSDIVQSLTDERARLTKAQADKTELEFKRLAGILLATEDVERSWNQLIAACRAKLLSLPTKAAPLIIAMADLAEAEDALTALVYEALDELTTFDASTLVTKTAGPGAENVPPAAEADGQPVGGSKPSAKQRSKRRTRRVEH